MEETLIQKHDSLYLTEGNLSLAAVQSTDSEVTRWLMFRVHQSILCIHSSIFRDMLALPAEGNTEQFEGVPLVRMPDSAADIEAVLKALYFGYKLPHPRLHPETPFAVRAMLSMATKYQISHIRDCIVERLESDWPQTILSWDTLEGELERTTEHSNIHWYTDDRFPEPASAIRLARDFNIPSILPAAFYQLSRLNIADDHARQRKEDNSLYDPSFNIARTARWDLLSGDDLLCVMRGQENLRKVVRQFVPPLLCGKTDFSQLCDISKVLNELSREHGAATTTDVLEHFRQITIHYRKEYAFERRFGRSCPNTSSSETMVPRGLTPLNMDLNITHDNTDLTILQCCRSIPAP